MANFIGKVSILKVILLCLIIVVSVFQINKTLRTNSIYNTASTVTSLKTEPLNKIDTYTNEANSLARNINSIFTFKSTKEANKAKLQEVLAARKDLIIRSFLGGEDIKNIPRLKSSMLDLANRNLVEQPIVLKGAVVHSLHEDNFITHKPSRRYIAIANKTQYNLIPSNYLGDVSGKIESVSGIVFGSTLYADKIDTKKIVKQPTQERPQKKNNTLVLLINFLDTQDVPFTVDQAKGLIFDGQFDKYTKEQSFQKVDFEGDVFGWITMPYTSNSTDCYPDNTVLDQFAIANNINLKNYDHHLNVINCYEVTAKGFSSVGKGLNILGGIENYTSVTSVLVSLSSALAPSYHKYWNISLPFDWSNLTFLLAHEMGHAQGLLHANGLDCGNNQIDAPCEYLEYGNAFDAMGTGGGYAFHHNATYKKQLGWLTDNDTVNITTSGKYKLSPLEIGPSTNPSIPSPLLHKRLAVISLPGQSEPTYAIERRAAIGFDKQLNQGNREGFYVLKLNGAGASNTIIDLQPTELDWFEDLLDSNLKNNTFSDPGAGLTIKALNNQEIEVILTPVVCERLAPNIHDGFVINQFGFKVYQTTIDNTDSTICPNSDFVVEFNPNPILSDTNPVVLTNIQAHSPFAVGLWYSITPGTLPGMYPAEIKATNTSSGLSTVKTINIEVIENSTCLSSGPTINELYDTGQSTLAFSATNADTIECPPADFITEIGPNPIFSSVGSLTSTYIKPGHDFSGFMSFEIAPNTPPGTYDVAGKSTNLNSGGFTKWTTQIIVP